MFKSLIQTCNAWPSQWDGVLENGREVYIRYRNNHFGVCYEEDILCGPLLLSLYLDVGGGGIMTTEEMLDILDKHKGWDHES